MEVQCRERPPAPHRVGEGQQRIGPEPDQAAHRVGRAVQHRAVEILGGDVVPPRRTERPIRHADRGGKVLRGGQVLPGDGGGRDRGEQHIAAGGVETAGQRVEQRHRARGFGGVGVMLMPAPGVVGDRASMPDEARSFLQLGGGNPAGRRHHVRRVLAAQHGIVVEDRAASQRSGRGGQTVFPIQGEVLAGAVIAAGGGVVRNRAGRVRVPRDEAFRVTGRGQVGFAQEGAGIGAHQMGPVAPVADEIAVVPPALDHDIGQPQRQRPIRAGPHTQPDIRLVRQAGTARVDHDQLHAALQRRHRRRGMGQAGDGGVVAPQDQAAALLDIRHPAAGAAGADAADAEGVARGEAAPPAAQVQRPDHVRRAEGIHQPAHEHRGIRDRGGGG